MEDQETVMWGTAFAASATLAVARKVKGAKMGEAAKDWVDRFEEVINTPVPVSKPDPWEHRGPGMKCETCMWYVPKKIKSDQGENPSILGRCRRRAPTMNGYPAVFHTDWCGDHKLDENRV